MREWPGEWVVAVGLALYVVASMLSVVEEWPKQGVTDTSYLVVLMWMVGGLALSAGAFMLGLMLVMKVGMASCVATSVVLGFKLRDTKNYRRHR